VTAVQRFQRRIHGAAAFEGGRAARVEPAGDREAGGVGHLTGDGAQPVAA
jgi:hypothetical protein